MPSKHTPHVAAVALANLAQVSGLDNVNNYLEAILAVANRDNAMTEKLLNMTKTRPEVFNERQMADLQIMLEFGNELTSRIDELLDWIASFGPTLDQLKKNVEERNPNAH